MPDALFACKGYRAAVYRAGPKGHPVRERSPLPSPVLAIIAHRAPGVILSVDETGGYILNLGVRFCGGAHNRHQSGSGRLPATLPQARHGGFPYPGEGVLRAPRRQRHRGLPRQVGGARHRSRFRRSHPGSGFHQAGEARQVLPGSAGRRPQLGFRHWPRCFRARVLPRHAVLLRAALRDRRRPRVRVSRLQARPLSPGRRLSCFLGQDRPAHIGQRMARCRRLRPLRRQLRHLHRHAAVDLGDLRRPPQEIGRAHGSSDLKTGPHISAKGWHDAGDYGRYVVNSGISTGTLLWTWEIFGGRLKQVKLNIPESGNGTPDILNEIRWNLDWMLSMQDDDGGVWHKQPSERFCDFILPEKDTLISYVIGTGKEPYKSSCATGDFAAVMAIAARAYRPFDAAYAEKCLRAARQAWSWLEKYPNVTFHNPPGIQTGDYGDGNCADEHLWAAAELWRTTGDEAFEHYFLEHFGAFRKTVKPNGPPAWGNVAPLALWTYALGHGKNADAVAAITQDSVSAAQQIVERSSRHPYRISLTSADYIWGSNGVAANYSMQLLVANALHPDPRFVATALDNLHYLLGRNTFSLSWVTQVGANPFHHPHHP